MTPGRRRRLVDEVRSTWQVSIRRACAVLQAERSSYHYKNHCPDRAQLKARIKEIAETHPRYGYRRVHMQLRREGWMINAKLVNRLYREMGLQLRHPLPKPTAEPKPIATAAKESGR
jgi:putative transposase